MSFKKICGCGWCGRRKSTLGENDNQDDQSPGKTKPSQVLHCVSKTFSRRPFLVLLVTLTVSTILSKWGVSQFGYPDFEDPYLVRNTFQWFENFLKIFKTTNFYLLGI